ncbi:type IV secretory system conjugative DNA transfer family protein [Gulosibacter macacae]|uniref:Type IV secretory system conjugative DNA transfer family protein n=1 Tax=Gulosibacter macacae TaxID=2488791 RepID=A0A3P3VUM2_9MICO|nr:type IV secretory system conjugative DNA transfer family protein [Gulosibacter macacae]RRJ85678.1 type IV secretory system conjugative DNA transfer family protein [Gulosibacter macacae]
MREPVTFTRVVPGQETTAQQVRDLIARLSTSDAPRPLVFETYANDEGITHMIGRTESGRRTVRTLIRSYLPDAHLLRTPRPEAPERVARLRAILSAMPLREDALEQTLHAIYSVLSARQKGETIALQVVLGRGRAPSQLPAKIPDPASSIARRVLRGVEPAPTETRRRVAQHVGQMRIDATIRVGVTAAVPERRRQLRGQLLGAFRQLEAPDARVGLVDESPTKWRAPASVWQGVTLTAAQLIPFVGWPVDRLDLPGLPPRHPKLLPAPKGINDTTSIFATTTAPGLARSVGIAPTARLQHMGITGGTGSGKSQIFAALTLSDIAARRPLVLVEPKRQLVDYIVTRAPKDAAGRIIVIDAAEPNPVGFNPLDIGDREPGPVVDGILEVFKAVFTDGWGPRTEDLLHAGLLTLVANGKRQGRPHTLLDLPMLISDDGYRRSVVGAVGNDPTLAAYWATFDGLSPAHRASIVAAPLNKLRKYVLRKNIAAVLGQSQPRFRLRDVWRDPEPKAVLVPLNDALMGPGGSQLLGGLVIASAWIATQERALEADPQARPGMVFIDEVQRYLHLPTSADDALATSRSYGVAWHLALQGRSQVPKSLALALELNARNQITFAASPHDAAALIKTTTKLQREDFQSLGRFEIYANLVVDGAPAGWFSAKTLPPEPPSGHGDYIRTAYRSQFAGDAAQVHPAADAATGNASGGATVGSHQKRRRA